MSRLTHEEVLVTVGPVDDIAAAEIIQTGASSAELALAQAWVSAADGNGQREPPAGRIGQVIEILEQIDMTPLAGPTPD
jgi:hypothetical protein